MKKIAIITGASSGMGKEVALTLTKNYSVDEMWIIARDEKRLEEVASHISIPVKIVSMDLTKADEFDKYEKLLKKEQPEVKILVNASGYGKFEKTTNISEADNIGMIKLNCEALTRMCLKTLPYISKDGKIVNFASVAAFQPVPYINVYAATKAYVLSFSRALNAEVKKEEISVMAVCPFWTKTNFFKRAVSENEVVKKYIAMYESKDVVNRLWRDLKKRKDVSKYGFIARGQVLLCKLLPHKLIMKIWMNQQKLN